MNKLENRHPEIENYIDNMGRKLGVPKVQDPYTPLSGSSLNFLQPPRYYTEDQVADILRSHQNNMELRMSHMMDSYAQQIQNYRDVLNYSHGFGIPGELEEIRKELKEAKRELKEKRELIKTIKDILKGGRMINRSDFFYSDNDVMCREHRVSHCEKCEEEYMALRSKGETEALILATSSQYHNDIEGIEVQRSAEKDLARKVRFIQKALNMSEKDVNKIKVKELNKELEKAEDKITVGGMRELLAEDKKIFGGFIMGIYLFFRKLFSFRTRGSNYY